jgi:hypothetical protein
MDRDPNHPLRLDLVARQEQLQQQLDEVCDEVVIPTSSTEELIKIEETLAAASEAAKEVISIRRKLDSDQGRV